MQKQISDEKRSGIYVLAVDDYLYRVGTLKGNWIFLPQDEQKLSKYDDRYESRYCLNVGYDLPAEPRKVDFDQNLADSKSKNLEVTSQESEKKKPHNSPSKSHKTKSIRL